MNGELAQAAALVAHGNHWFRVGGGAAPAPISLEGAAFQFVSSVDFVLVDDAGTQVERFADVAAWLEALQARGIDRLWLELSADRPDTHGFVIEAHQLSAFAGGGSWFLVATGPARSEAWQGAWRVGDRNAPDHRIWEIRYQGNAVDPVVAPAEPDIDAARAGLAAQLTAAHDFAAAQAAGDRPDVGMWADIFGQAIALLTGDPSTVPVGESYDDDALPADHPPPARRLLAAAGRAWVFGGMGSWNDLGFDPTANATYDAVSRHLHAAVLHAVVAATNAHP